CFSQSKVKRLGVLREVTRTCTNKLGQRSLLLAIGNWQSAIGHLHIHSRSDGIPVRLRSNQTQGHRLPLGAAFVSKNSELRSKTTLEEQIETAVAVQIGGSESPAVFRKIESGDAREVIVPTGAARIEHVGLPAIPTVVLADQLVQGVPAVLIAGCRFERVGRARDHLTPEEAGQIFL